MKSPASKRLQSERGIALIVVLWILAFLMFIVIEFAYTMRIETDTVRNLKDETSARHLALAGINLGLAELSAKYDLVYINKKGDVTLGEKIGDKITSTSVTRELDLGDGHVRYRIDDEDGKLNINTATRSQIKALLLETGVDTTTRDVIADSILDWRDTNHEFHFNGAEDDYYGSLTKPYGAKDGKFDTTEELLLVKGVTPEIFYGDGNLPYEYGLNANNGNENSRHLYKGLAQHITVAGEGKVNLNTADATVLTAMLGKGRSMAIELSRENKGIIKWPKFGGRITSEVFSIKSEGEVHGMKVIVKAIAKRLPKRDEPVVIYWNSDERAFN